MSPYTLKRLALTVLAALGTAAVRADSQGARVLASPKYQQECASCHMAYPPGLLPAASWQHLMGSLKQHYGTDASLDEASQREISGWLQTHAGTYKRVSEAPPQDRITQSVWFQRQHHTSNVPAGGGKRAAVGRTLTWAACDPAGLERR